MARNIYATRDVPVAFKKLGGGLNTTAGPLGLQENEASDVQNIDFDKFGSILQRNGYTDIVELPGTPTNPASDGLYWFEFDSGGGATARRSIKIADSKMLAQTSIGPTWTDVTGGLTITPGFHCDFETFLNTVLVTNGQDAPWQWDGNLGGTATTMTVPANLTKAKFVRQFQNYTILANVELSTTGSHPSRFYWSTIQSISAWNAADFIEVSRDDGQEITGIKVLGDRLVIYKTKSIYIALFTGDRDIPFIVQKTNSPVGCIAPFSIQATENGHVFAAYDGIYFFDGANAYKLSDRINRTYTTLNRIQLPNARSLYQYDKNRYWLAVPEAGSTENNKVIVWHSFNNAFSIYSGMSISAMSTFTINSIEERPYFDDYSGFTYRADFGIDDYPLGNQTGVDAYYATNWKNFDDLVSQKDVPHIYVYYQIAEANITLSWAFDFNEGEELSQTFFIGTTGALWDQAVWDQDKWAVAGGGVQRRDLTGRGRLVRFKFGNNAINESFQIDGIGVHTGLETNF
jgi:hypothetical protein